MKKGKSSSFFSRCVKAVKSDPLPLVVPLVFTAAIAVCLLLCFDQIRDAELRRVDGILRDSAYEQVSLFKNSLRTQELFLNLLKSQIEEHDMSKETLVREAKTAARASDLAYIAVVTPDGRAYGTDNNEYNVAERAYFKRALFGEKNISFIPASKADDRAYIVISVPCREKNGSVKYVLCGYYSAKAMQNLVVSEAFGGGAYSYIADMHGYLIIGSSHTDFLLSKTKCKGSSYGANIFAMLSEASFEGTALADIVSDTVKGRESHASFTIKGEKRFSYYVPIGINGWFMINSVPDFIINKEISSSTRYAMVLVIAVLIMGLIYIVYVLKRENLLRRKIEKEKEQIMLHEQEYKIAAAHSDSVIFRYDIKAKELLLTPEAAAKMGLPEVMRNIPESLIKDGIIPEDCADEFRKFYTSIADGSPSKTMTLKAITPSGKQVWHRMNATLIFDMAGEPLHAVITSHDITEQREREIAGELWTQSIATMPRDKSLIIEYNVTRKVTDKITGSMRLRFCDIPDCCDFHTITDIWIETNVYQDDREKYAKFVDLNRLLALFYIGQTGDESLDFRGYTEKDENWRWLRISVKLARYPDNDDIKAFIIITDIHEEKSRRLEIEAMSKQDSLTGVLNRKTFTDEVCLALENEAASHHALIMVDLDDFKIINDTFGHIAGDKIIISAAEIFKSQLRSGDLIGRVGGDEFMLLLKNIPGSDIVRRRAETLSEMLKMEIVKGAHSSASMGIALYPENGTTFDELYSNSDLALYKAKENKGSFWFSTAAGSATCPIKPSHTDF